MIARLMSPMSVRIPHRIRELPSGRYRLRMANFDKFSGDRTGVGVLSESENQIRDGAFVGGPQKIRRRGLVRPRRIQPHIEWSIVGKPQSAGRIVDLRRRESEVRQDRVGGDRLAAKEGRHPDETPMKWRNQRGRGFPGDAFSGVGEVARIKIAERDPAAGSDRLRELHGVSTAACRQIDHRLAGMRIEQLQTGVREYRDVSVSMGRSVPLIVIGSGHVRTVPSRPMRNLPRPLSFTLVLTLLALAVAWLPGCNGVRFSVDLLPSSNALVETTVMTPRPGEARAGWRSAKRGKIVLIDVNGAIADRDTGTILSPGPNPVDRLAESLMKARDDSEVRAIVIRINSPGGTVTASDIMYREVMRFKEITEKPVVISMGGVTASGGYYIAVAGDYLIASPTTTTGSIGVILQYVNVEGGLQKLGVQTEAIVSGENKTILSPFDAMTGERRAILQTMVDEFYDQFLAVVVAGRPKMAPQRIRDLADGRVMSGERAAEVGLVDAVGGIEEAYAKARELADAPDANLVKYHTASARVRTAYATTGGAPARAQGDASQNANNSIDIDLISLDLDSLMMQGGPSFWYIWR